MENWQVRSLDVWGHGPDECADYGCPGEDRCEGYQVNDVFRAGELELPDECDDAAVVAALIDQGYLNEKAREPGAVALQWSDGDFCEVNDGKDGRPIFQLAR